MAKPKLNTQDFCRASQRLKCQVAAIKSVASVESAGNGFLPDDRVIILFERHHFARLTKNKFNRDFPQISNRSPGGYYGKEKEYQRFNAAFALDPDAAMKSASWGKFQILGSNHAVCGFRTVGEFVDAMKDGEGRQLDAFCGFVEGNHLTTKLRNLDWAGFARGYNGSGYKKNQYDVKMANAYRKFAKENIDCNSISAAATAKDEPARSVDKVGAATSLGRETSNQTADKPPPITQPIEVEKVVAAPDKPNDLISRFSAKLLAIPAAILAYLSSVGAWMSSAPQELVIALVSAAALIVFVYVILNMINKTRRESREDRLKAEREQRAHEVQLAMLKAAADPNMNTLKIVEPPVVEIQNSDSKELVAITEE